MAESGQSGARDQDGKKLKYPISVAFIIIQMFLDRFCYDGLRTMLVIYLSTILLYSANESTVIYHTFGITEYCMCIIGAILADSWLGKFKGTLYFSVLYIGGSVLIFVASMPRLETHANMMTLVGLFSVAFGSGGMKPCISAFGGDQFKLPEQEKQMAKFFSLFYFFRNLSALVSISIVPILRHDVQCFGKLSCYPLALSVCTALAIISIVIFIFGRPLYIIKRPETNMVVQVSKAMCVATTLRCKEGKQNPQPHWMDHAAKKYDQKLINEIKAAIRILILYVPLPLFWALFEQQGSKWVFQAARMNGRVGSFTIKPEQFQLLNPLLVVALIPLFDVAFYPLLEKIGVKRRLQKLSIGGILAACAFLISAGVEFYLETTYPDLPSVDVGQLRIFNGVSECNYLANTDLPNYAEFTVNSMDYFEEKFVKLDEITTFNFQLTPVEGENAPNCPNFKGLLELEEKKAISYFIYEANQQLVALKFIDYVDKPKSSNPLVGVLAYFPQPTVVELKSSKKIEPVKFKDIHPNTEKLEVTAANYEVFVDEKKALSAETLYGGVYTILLSQDQANNIKSKVITITEPNSVSIFWLIPQYFVMTVAEIMFSVTGLEFSYAQAPLSMKSFIQACWLLTSALGNVIVVIIANARIFDSEAYEFLLYSCLMFIDIGIFIILAYRYKSNNPNEIND